MQCGPNLHQGPCESDSAATLLGHSFRVRKGGTCGDESCVSCTRSSTPQCYNQSPDSMVILAVDSPSIALLFKWGGLKTVWAVPFESFRVYYLERVGDTMPTAQALAPLRAFPSPQGVCIFKLLGYEHSDISHGSLPHAHIHTPPQSPAIHYREVQETLGHRVPR